jgi:hypothetical protein
MCNDPALIEALFIIKDDSVGARIALETTNEFVRR